MDKYIEREAAMHIAFKSPFFSDALMEEMKAIPAADVATVRHGRWIETPRLYYGAKQYECSLCYSDTFWNKHCITEKYPHCPNCGAKMDLSDECEQEVER